MSEASTVANYKQQAAAELAIGIGHLDAAIHLWSPGTGLSPAEEAENEEVAAWRHLNNLVTQIKQFADDEGPGA